MKKSIITLVFTAFVVLAFAQKQLPDINLKTLEGKPINAKQLAQKGKITVISFWATWCAPCVKELPLLEKLNAENRESIKITLINLDFAIL